MKKTINFLITCTVFTLVIQFYASESKTAMAQTDRTASEELSNQGNENTEKKTQYLETEDENVREVNQRGERTFLENLRQTEGGGIGSSREKLPEDVRLEDVPTSDNDNDNLPAESPIEESEY